jgi:CRP-like cAMP-binding protein
MTASDHLAPQALASLELFQDLPSAALDDVLTSARVWRLPRETRIFNQGDAGRAHALIEGSIRISQSGSDGAQIVMRFIAPGEMFGTVALFTDGRYPADAITLTASLEASWSEAELFVLMGRHPQIAINVIRVIGKRLQEVQDRLRGVPPNGSNSALPVPSCGLFGRPDTARPTARRSSFRCDARMWRTSPGPRSIRRAAS